MYSSWVNPVRDPGDSGEVQTKSISNGVKLYIIMNRKIPIQISARHIHLSQKDLEALFGKGYQLRKLRDLSQSEEFMAEETIDIQKNLDLDARKILKMRVLGPIRNQTQIELSHTDAIFLGINPIVRKSGDLKKTPGAVLIGPKNKIKIKEGVINAWRHMHCNPKEAKELGLKDGILVSVKTSGICSITFHKVIVRVKPNYRLCMHLDTDEGNASCMIKKGEGYLLGSFVRR